jgi:hypothetical protein
MAAQSSTLLAYGRVSRRPLAPNPSAKIEKLAGRRPDDSVPLPAPPTPPAPPSSHARPPQTAHPRPSARARAPDARQRQIGAYFATASTGSPRPALSTRLADCLDAVAAAHPGVFVDVALSDDDDGEA